MSMTREEFIAACGNGVPQLVVDFSEKLNYDVLRHLRNNDTKAAYDVLIVSQYFVLTIEDTMPPGFPYTMFMESVTKGVTKNQMANILKLAED